MQIIVASGNIFCRELSSFILSEAGYTILEVCDREGLLCCLDEHEPDMVLLDTRLLGSESMDVVSRIRHHRLIPILLLTNGISSRNALQTFGSCGDDCVHWPYQADDFLSHVRNLLCRFTGCATSAPMVSC